MLREWPLLGSRMMRVAFGTVSKHEYLLQFDSPYATRSTGPHETCSPIDDPVGRPSRESIGRRHPSVGERQGEVVFPTGLDVPILLGPCFQVFVEYLCVSRHMPRKRFEERRPSRQ